jgi:integrase
MKNRPLIRLNELDESGLTASHGLFIKRPNHQRKTFSMVPYVRRDGKKTYEKPLNIHELNQLNELLSSNKITPINADRQVASIKAKIDEYLQSLSVDSGLGLNLEIAERFLKNKEVKSKNRGTSDNSYRSSMIRAVKLLGKKSLLTDSDVDLQKEFDKNFDGTPERHKDLTSRINTLLKFLNRNITLVAHKKSDRFVKHITIEELEILIRHTPNPDERVMIGVAGYCGLRMGELFGLTLKSRIARDVLYINNQKYDKPDSKTGKIYGPPKGNKNRKTIIISGGEMYVDEFLKNGAAYYEYLRRDVVTTVQTLCKELWPYDPDKHLNDFHDLRDVFAIHLVSSGSPIDSVAKLMGNSPAVCLANYQGFIASDREVDLVRSILKK